MPTESPPPVEHLQIAVAGQTLYAAAAGPEDGPLVVLLHGFPEISYGWRRQIGPLAAAGLRVVAPDQRGYGHSSKPEGREAYRIDVLAADVAALARGFGRERFSLVGHDWGGIVAWHLASQKDSPVERLAILNAPRLDGFARYLSRHPLQVLMSSYVAGFQLPVLPELALRAGGYALLQSALEGNARPGTFSAEELAVYQRAWAMPGALTTMLNWYRALPLAPRRKAGRVRAPTLVVWGDRDSALQAGLAEASAEACDEVEIVHLPEAGHWVQHEEAERVNALLLSFLRKRG
ncbi:MAG: alpha/beta fold hydrolase [Caldimonas sp.]